MANLLSSLLGKTRLVDKRQQLESKPTKFAEILRASPVKFSQVPSISKSVKQFVRSIT